MALIGQRTRIAPNEKLLKAHFLKAKVAARTHEFLGNFFFRRFGLNEFLCRKKAKFCPIQPNVAGNI